MGHMCVQVFAGKAWNSMVLISIPLKKKEKKKSIKPLRYLFNSVTVKQLNHVIAI